MNARFMLYNIYDVFKRLKGSRAESNDKLVLKKIREGEILKNDRRFNHYRTGKLENSFVQILLTEADNDWCKETGLGQYAVSEKRELFRLRAEVSERVGQRARRALHPFLISLSYRFFPTE
jgi:hypothetical protein